MATEPAKEYPYDVVRGTFFEHDVPISQMFVDFRTHPGGYARPLRSRREDKLVAEWDRQAVGVLLLSMREDGSMAVIDGQHRLGAARRMGIETLDAMVFIDLTTEDEARLYRKFGDYLKQSPLDKYHAAITEGVLEYLAIDRVIRALGLHVPQTLGSANNTIDAVDGVLYVSKTYGLSVLSESLKLLHAAWDGDHRAYRGQLIRGAAAFLARFATSKKYARKRLLDRMTRLGLSQVEQRAYKLREASLAANPAAAFGQALLFVHDQGITEERQLGDWPKRHLSEETAKQLADALRARNASQTPEQRSAKATKANASMTPEQRTARTLKGAVTRFGPSGLSIPCPFCYVEAGKPCINKDTGTTLQYHHKARQGSKAS